MCVWDLTMQRIDDKINQNCSLVQSYTWHTKVKSFECWQYTGTSRHRANMSVNQTVATGATILPVWPTWRSLETKPASTAAREAPTAAPSRSARSYSSLKLSPLFIPRPPDTTILAPLSSGRSVLLSCWPHHSLTSFVTADDETVIDKPHSNRQLRR